ncbi:MAG TPA: type VI secretion protein IcmF/TssM N-terminal domain-containing protein [Polyangia bacterium]|nr:type VI secretion protein IcmF/TssM N-terminal domain-containing protein [Polyangia bacterium]
MERITALLKSLPRPVLILLAVLIVALLVLAVVLLVRWWRARKKKGPGAADTPQAPALPRDRLARVREEFLRGLPPAAAEYPTAIVLGEIGTGKSHLIDSHVDWRGQANQLLPSVLRDPLIQLYLGERLVAQELAAPVLRDTTPEMGRALTALWAPLGSQRPIVLVCIDARQLGDPAAEADLREFGQLVRGKLHLLSQMRREPVAVRLCLTHMDLIEGYGEFVRLLRAQGEEPSLDLTRPAPSSTASTSPGPPQLADWLAPYEAYLALGLTTLSPEAFARLVAFYTHGGALLGALTPLLDALMAEESLVERPRLERLYFSALAHDEQPGTPFAVDRAALASDQAARLRRLRLRCLALAAAWTLLLGGLYVYHRIRIAQAGQIVAAFQRAVEVAPLKSGSTAPLSGREAARAEEEAGAALTDLRRSESFWPLLPTSYVAEKQDLRHRLTGSIRQLYLLPLFQKSRDTSRLLHALALLYASRGSELASLILPDRSAWARRLQIPDPSVSDYIDNSDQPWDGSVEMPSRDGGVNAALATLDPWIHFLQDLERAAATPDLTPQDLQRLQQEAAPLAAALDELRPYHESTALVDLLVRNRWLNLDALFPPPAPSSPGAGSNDVRAWIDAHFTTLDGLLGLVQQTSLALPPVSSLGLRTFMSRVPALAMVTRTADTTYQIEPRPGLRFTFSTKAWWDLIESARTRLLLAAYTNVPRSSGGLFFGPDARYSDLPRGTTGRGATVSVPGLYTRAAVEGDVVPALTPLDQQLAALALPEDDRTQFDTFVADEVDRYAGDYHDRLGNYYGSFTFDARSVDALRQGLSSLRAPSSWMVSFLKTVADNAAPMLGTSTYVEPLQDELGTFQPLVTLLQPSKGSYPQLDPYLALVGMLDAALGGTLPEGSAASPQGGLPLAAELQPVGQVALDMLLGTKASLLAAVQQWAAGAGLDQGLSRPFLLPFQRAYELGLGNIESTVASDWQSLQPQVTAALGRFPFRRTATDTLSPAEFESLFGPQGRFWQFFTRSVAPLCIQRDGLWVMRSAPYRAPQLPAGLLDLANALSRTRSALWDDKGMPKPLIYNVKPLPLPTIPADGTQAATLAYLRVGAGDGATTVYSFNQTPAWQPLQVSWDQLEAASVGLQLSPIGRGGKGQVGQSQYPALEVNDAAWNFHRLLTRGKLSSQLVASWTLSPDAASGAAGGQAQTVLFTFDSDPWTPFQVSAPASPR